MAEFKRKTFLYKQASFQVETGDPSLTLEKLLRKEIKNSPKIHDRLENPNDTEFRFLNYCGSRSTTQGEVNILGCEFLSYDRESNPSSFTLDPTATVVNVNALTPKQGEQLVEGAAYVGVMGNHVIMVQSKGFRSIDLQHYLNWLLFLRRATNEVSENLVSLSDVVPRNRKIKGVKSINLSAPLQFKGLGGKPVSIGARQDEHRKRHLSIKPEGPAWEAVQTFLSAFHLPTEINMADLTRVPRIDVELSLRWHPARDEEDVDFMNSIAKNFSHVDDELSYTIKTRSGDITKDQFKRKRDFSLRWKKAQPDFDDIYPKMASWLAELINSGTVPS